VPHWAQVMPRMPSRWGDTAFMRTATVVSALTGFLPLVWLSLVFGWGLAGI